MKIRTETEGNFVRSPFFKFTKESDYALSVCNYAVGIYSKPLLFYEY